MPLEDDFLVSREQHLSECRIVLTSSTHRTPALLAGNDSHCGLLYDQCITRCLSTSGAGAKVVTTLVEYGLHGATAYIGKFMKMQRHISFGFVRFVCHVCVDSCVCVM